MNRQYERTWAEIDLDALDNNIREIRRHISPETGIMAIVKADGYGHGAAEISQILLDAGADKLGVATLDEAIALRNAGIQAEVLLMGFTPAERFGEVAELGFTQTLFSEASAKLLNEAAKARNAVTPVYIKVDTGMARLGFLPDEDGKNAVKRIHALSNLTLAGIFTHLAQSDGGAEDFTREQVAEFTAFLEKLEAEGVRIPVKHVSNSAGIMNFHEFNFSMVRAGIMLYGLPPSAAVNSEGWNLKRAMSWKSRVAFMKRVPAGTSIGYSRTFYTKRDSVIATVPCGYADGYARLLSNRGKVLIGGCVAPIVGNVCMDYFMVETTDIPGVCEGDEVVLVGRQGEREITADELGAIYGTINYEVVCGVSKRVPRLYMKGDECVKRVNWALS